MAAKRKERADQSPGPPTASPPKTASTLTRPTTPTSPVQIPKSKRDTAHAHALKHHPHGHHHHHHGERRDRSNSPRPEDVHSPDAIPPSVAALLAMTTIPPPRSQRNLRQRLAKEKRMTVDSIIEQTQESEKELSLNFCRSPLDVLLSPPDDSDADSMSIADSTMGPESALSTRTVSLDSVPSLADSFATETLPSVETPCTPSGELEDHPLSSPDISIDELDFRVFETSPSLESKKSQARMPLQPLKSAFKSNLTASLRALRNAARSFSSLNLTSIPPEDFLTRSILTLDPPVPYTDERRPPALEEEPSAAMRRYLNPTQTSRLESRSSSPASASSPTPASRSGFTASIQMQTYKVQRSRSASPSARMPRRSLISQPAGEADHAKQKETTLSVSVPGPRQREMRENSDFIRIAVMEMAMRRRGKLDDQRPGRARWALPPRKVSTRPYEIGTDGVPARWISTTAVY
ncbi:hypothetical protein NKR23_g9587 [Pleurostoma richardsiae]|uniref:Uncharacterized protein n=1 Tax=Pleurostoma richardsiae TaxID=41990 RepID=A0AA38VC59_9PEZI|nr:hypothetical protein NKR23_g9587 [Pleurostoma richardsiae]